MNYIIKGIIIVVAITSMLVVVATTMIPLAQNTYAQAPTSTCNPSTVENQTATPAGNGTCTATMSFSMFGTNNSTNINTALKDAVDNFVDQCSRIPGTFTENETSMRILNATCTFPATPP